MSEIVIYGSKGKVIAKPFQINSADDEPEAIAEEENIINYNCDKTQEGLSPNQDKSD